MRTGPGFLSMHRPCNRRGSGIPDIPLHTSFSGEPIWFFPPAPGIRSISKHVLMKQLFLEKLVVSLDFGIFPLRILVTARISPWYSDLRAVCCIGCSNGNQSLSAFMLFIPPWLIWNLPPVQKIPPDTKNRFDSRPPCDAGKKRLREDRIYGPCPPSVQLIAIHSRYTGSIRCSLSRRGRRRRGSLVSSGAMSCNSANRYHVLAIERDREWE